MILLSFDIEEFDVPRERGFSIPLEASVKISKIGFEKILDILMKNDVKATFFCTANFVEHEPEIIFRAIREGHEIASHGYDHWEPKEDDPKTSKYKIEGLIGILINGYRQPRMFPVNQELIKECGYTYNSSINPAFIPGKYMHLGEPRTAFMDNNVLQIPASVTPHTRIPLFWLSLHTFPEITYFKLADQVLHKDSYFTTYFHPWEFVDHPKNIYKYMLPIVKHNNGSNMCKRLDNLIKHFKKQNQTFVRFNDFVLSYKQGINNVY